MAALADLPVLTAALSRALASAGIEHAISGATAMAAHGYVRATQDVDVLVSVPALRLPEVFAIVRALGFAGEDRALIASLRERYVATLRSGPASVEVLVPVLPYHRRLLGRVTRRRIGEVEIPFVSVEDLVILKLLWHRAKDVPDVHALLAANAASFDARYATETLRDLLPASDPRHGELAGLLARFVPGPPSRAGAPEGEGP